jgi:hypothetical protein
MNIRFTEHAVEECERRGIPIAIVQTVTESPQQIVPNIEGRQAYQSQIVFGDKTYLVRVIVEQADEELVVVTVYRTSKIEKYWSKS